MSVVRKTSDDQIQLLQDYRKSSLQSQEKQKQNDEGEIGFQMIIRDQKQNNKQTLNQRQESVKSDHSFYSKKSLKSQHKEGDKEKTQPINNQNKKQQFTSSKSKVGQNLQQQKEKEKNRSNIKITNISKISTKQKPKNTKLEKKTINDKQKEQSKFKKQNTTNNSQKESNIKGNNQKSFKIQIQKVNQMKKNIQMQKIFSCRDSRQILINNSQKEQNPRAFNLVLHNNISIISESSTNQVFTTEQEWKLFFQNAVCDCDDYKVINTIIKMKKKSLNNVSEQKQANSIQYKVINQNNQNLKMFWKGIIQKIDEKQCIFKNKQNQININGNNKETVNETLLKLDHVKDKQKHLKWMKSPKRLNNTRQARLIQKNMKRIKRLVSSIVKKLHLFNDVIDDPILVTKNAKNQQLLIEEWCQWIHKFLNEYSCLDIQVGYSKGIQYLCLGILISSYEIFNQNSSNNLNSDNSQKSFLNNQLSYEIMKKLTLYLLTHHDLRKMYLPGSPLFFVSLQKLSLMINQKILIRMKDQNADFVSIFIGYFKTMLLNIFIDNTRQSNESNNQDSTQRIDINTIKAFQKRKIIIEKIFQLLLIDGINSISTILYRIMNLSQEKILNFKANFQLKNLENIKQRRISSKKNLNEEKQLLSKTQLNSNNNQSLNPTNNLSLSFQFYYCQNEQQNLNPYQAYKDQFLEFIAGHLMKQYFFSQKKSYKNQKSLKKQQKQILKNNLEFEQLFYQILIIPQ